MGVLHVQARLDAPTGFIVVRVVGREDGTSVGTQDREGRRRGNVEQRVERREVLRHRRAPEGVDDENRLPGAVQGGWEIVRAAHEARRVAHEPRSAEWQAVGSDRTREHLHVRRSRDVVEIPSRDAGRLEPRRARARGVLRAAPAERRQDERGGDAGRQSHMVLLPKPRTGHESWSARTGRDSWQVETAQARSGGVDSRDGVPTLAPIPMTPCP